MKSFIHSGANVTINDLMDLLTWQNIAFIHIYVFISDASGFFLLIKTHRLLHFG